MADTEKKRPAYQVRNSLVNYYLLVMFTFFPLFLTNSYGHARTDKFWLFVILTGVLTLAVTAATLLRSKEQKELSLKNEGFVPLTAPDIAMLGFFVFAVISAFLSDHFEDTIIAGVGRNNGLVLLALYLSAYFIVTRLYIFKEYVIAAYLVFSSFVSLLAVLNFYYIDPLGILNGYSERVAEDFGSTIGNKNMIASFICVFLPIAVMMFVLTKKRYMKILSGVSVGIAYAGLICADSNSGYLGLGAVILFMLIFCSRDYDRFRNYMFALGILFSSGKILRLFSLMMNDHSKKFETIPKFLLFDPVMVIPAIFFLLVFIVMTVFKRQLEPIYSPRFMTVTFIAVLVLLFCSVAGLFLYFSLIDTERDLGIWSKLLRFNEKWGTHRGFMWINGMKDFASFDIVHKLFGSGPDTFYFVFEPHFEELLKFGDSSTDCIHNEYLNYLVTQGILGIAAYLTLIISVIVRAIKTSFKDPITLVFISAVICYCAQATVNIYQPISTPAMILFLSMAEAANRKYAYEEVVK